jgi:hypothetical protein
MRHQWRFGWSDSLIQINDARLHAYFRDFFALLMHLKAARFRWPIAVDKRGTS